MPVIVAVLSVPITTIEAAMNCYLQQITVFPEAIQCLALYGWLYSCFRRHSVRRLLLAARVLVSVM